MLDVHGFKVWPACGYTRPTNTATLDLRREHGIQPEQVEGITIVGGTGATQLLSEPLELKRRPKLSIDGKYSIPFTTAVMMVKGNVTLADYTAEGLRDARVLEMADRVTYRADPHAVMPAGGSSSVSRPSVEIRLKDGRTFSRRPDGVPGDPQHPVTHEMLEAKFRDCVSFAAKPLSTPDVDRAIALIGRLEDVPDVVEIMELLTP
jgi:2-methylcitrate dehydratase PrpD